MAITQTIATLPAVLNDSATFYEDIAERNNSLVTTVLPSINAWATQANLTQTEINTTAAQVAAASVNGGYSQNYINTNFVGVNNAQNITEVKTFTASPIVPTPTTDFQVATKKYVDDNNKINTLTNKTTPDDTDNIALQEVGGDLKRVSFQNLTKLSPNDSRAKTALNASGAAPIYACRSWVNFKGTGTVAIRASGNVSSITDGGVGSYIVNFTTNMPDVNYSWSIDGYYSGGVGGLTATNGALTTSSIQILCVTTAMTDFWDSEYTSVSIFR